MKVHWTGKFADAAHTMHVAAPQDVWDTASECWRVTGIWRFECKHARGYVSPLVSSGTRVYGETDGLASAWDAGTGAIVWQQPGINMAFQVAMGSGKLLLLLLGAAGEAACLRVGR